MDVSILPCLALCRVSVALLPLALLSSAYLGPGRESPWSYFSSSTSLVLGASHRAPLNWPLSQNSLGEEERNGWRRCTAPPSASPISQQLPAAPMASCEGLLPLLWASPLHASWEGADLFSMSGRSTLPPHPRPSSLSNLLQPGPPWPSYDSQRSDSSLITSECGSAPLSPRPRGSWAVVLSGPPLLWPLSSF